MCNGCIGTTLYFKIKLWLLQALATAILSKMIFFLFRLPYFSATNPVIFKTYENDTDGFSENDNYSSGSEFIPPSDFSCESSDSDVFPRDITSTFLNDADDFHTPTVSINVRTFLLSTEIS